MNIVVPMAGLGSRFLMGGYNLPKPLIDVNGSPMIVRAITSLDLLDAKFYFVVTKNQYTKNIKTALEKVVDCTFKEINYLTEGPACSAKLFEKEINNNNELMIVNCDQIMEWNSSSFLLNARQYDGTIVTYYETTDKNSYAKIDKKGYVVQIKEKEVISNISLNGIHYWKRGEYFIDSATEMIKADDRSPNGEFYVGPTYNYMISKGFKIGIYHIPKEQHHPVGVPEDLKKFIDYDRI